MTESLKQWERVKRALLRIENNKNRQMDEYEDDVWNFFQNCWHLKDWIKNDTAIDSVHREPVECDVKKVDELVICADLCNRSKHLKLTRKCVDADVTGRDITVSAAPPGKGYGEYNFKITIDDGRTFDAINVARISVKKWAGLLTSYGVI
jgi:hypothetical protein